MRKSFVFILILFLSFYGNSQTIDFETTVPNNISATSGQLSISNDHYKLGTASLRWDYMAGDTLVIDTPNINPAWVVEFYHHTAQLWVHNETNVDDTITFEFLDTLGVVNYHFDFILNFDGWRKILRSYKYDMYRIWGSTSHIGKVRIIAPPSSSGSLFFDEWTYVMGRTARYKTYQMPDVSGYSSTSAYFDMDTLSPDIPLTVPTATELTDLASIRTKINDSFKGGSPNLTAANNFYNDLNIVIANGKIKGKAITPTDASDYIDAFARDYYHKGTAASLTKAEHILWLVHDGGFAAGSASSFGNGYGTRNFRKGIALIFPDLNPQLQVKIRTAVFWVMRAGQIWVSGGDTQISSDYIHTEIIYLLAMLVHEEDDVAVQNLKGFKRFLEYKNKASYNTGGWLKSDGTSFHHNTHYWAYMYSYTSYVGLLAKLDGTQFQINQEAYEYFRDAAYAFLIFCNGGKYANSLSGRHPFNTNLGMSKIAYNQLAYIGGNILGETADSIIAGAYNRIWNDDVGLSAYPAENFPEGFFQFNYSPVGIYRKNNWVATIHGMNNTFWGTEIYSNANRYGRYQSYGAVEIMYPGGQLTSGMQRDGYDWNYAPGTTSKVLSWANLDPIHTRADERAETDYAAALRFEKAANGLKGNEGNIGMYGMDFQQKSISHSHDSSFKFKKSMFCFDDMIVCLGSNINCADAQNEIVTTLFQGFLPTTTTSIYANGNNITAFPYDEKLSAGENWVLDAWGTGYYVNSSDSIQITRTHQTSPNQNGDGTTTNDDFAKAWIKHGTAPVEKNYEFVIKPNTTPTEMEDFMLNMQGISTLSGANTNVIPYEIFQQNSTAHIVKHHNSEVVAYNLFQANTNLPGGIVLENDRSVLVMAKATADTLELSMVDPSTSFNQSSTTQITINGNYDIQTSSDGVSLVSAGGGQTVLALSLRDGAPLDAQLVVNQALPIELNSFQVEAQNEHAQLLWETASELDNKGFEIQHSLDGRVWEKIGFRQGNGTTTSSSFYKFLHTEPVIGLNYYRLQQIDWNGDFEFSPVRSITFSGNKIQVFPNPTKGLVFVQFPNEKNERKIIVRNTIGKIVMIINAPKDFMEVDLSHLKSGMYFIECGGELVSKMILI